MKKTVSMNNIIIFLTLLFFLIFILFFIFEGIQIKYKKLT
jgi:hypothetical protein